MKTFRRALFTIIALWGCLGAADPVPLEKMKEIEFLIRQARSAETSEVRTESARRLSEMVKQVSSFKVGDKLTYELASLLREHDDSVRYWAATTLGYLGPQVNPAVPALQKALGEREADHKSKTSATAIRLALERIQQRNE